MSPLADPPKMRLVSSTPEVDAAALAEPRPAAAGGAATKRVSRGRVQVLMLADALALTAALLLAMTVADVVAGPAVVAPAWAQPLLAAAAIAGWLGVFAAYRLYDGQTRTIAPGGPDEMGALFHALLAGSLLFLLAGQALARVSGWAAYTPLEAGLFIAAALGAVPVVRAAARTWLLPHLVRPRRALIVGAGQVGRMVERKLGAHPEYGLELVGFVDDDFVQVGPGRILGRTADLTQIVDAHEIDWVLLAFSRTSCETMLEAVRAVRRPDVHLAVVPNYFELFASNATIEDLEGIPVVSLPPLRLSRPVRTLKRAVDLVAAAAGLLALSPLLICAAVAIRLDSKGPVFFRQPRHGRGGRTFRIVKFRTMVDGAEAQRHALAHLNEMEGGGPLFKMRDDPRITRVGAFLRKTSIDELPQLWNVLRGEMSLVGPRPFVVHESEQITGWASRRLETTPGITGLWQVLGRNDIPFEEMVKLDYIYVTNWSLWWDLKILFQTIPVVLGRRGAY